MSVTRRMFLRSAAISAGGMLLNLPVFSIPEELDEFMRKQMASIPVAGLGACIVKDGGVAWSKGYGWADIEKKIPYDPERTIQNIASVSKTITATAVMQLWEQDKFRFDDDVNDYLSFSVRNPRFPDVPVTFRQLLAHRSSILDGPFYVGHTDVPGSHLLGNGRRPVCLDVVKVIAQAQRHQARFLQDAP